MPRRAIILLSLGAIVVALVSVSWLLGRELVGLFITAPGQGIAVHVSIDNHTDQPIGPFVISDRNQASATQVGQIGPNMSAEIDFGDRDAGGENEIDMRDLSGRRYVVVAYFENSLGGRVDMRIEQVSAQGLIGHRRELVSYFGSMTWWPLKPVDP